MNQPARRKTDADATGYESIRRDSYILWKTFALSSFCPQQTSISDEKPRKSGVVLAVHSQAVPADGRTAEACAGVAPAPTRITPQTKDPSGGTTGRVKLYGRLGWMGARAEYSLDGEG